MSDPILLISIGLALLFLLGALIGKRRAYQQSTKWRKALAGSMWAVNAMLFGGVSSPVEKGKVVKIRKRSADEDDDTDS